MDALSRSLNGFNAQDVDFFTTKDDTLFTTNVDELSSS